MIRTPIQRMLACLKDATRTDEDTIRRTTVMWMLEQFLPEEKALLEAAYFAGTDLREGGETFDEFYSKLRG